MFSGIIRHLPVAMTAVAVMTAAALPGGTAAADPGQDQKFFDLLGQKDIPPVDGDGGLIVTAHKVCSRLDEGMSVGDMVDLIRNNGFNENPLTRLNNPDRITRTINRFITASVEAYCPGDRGKIAAIAAYRKTPPGDRGFQVTEYAHGAAAPRGVVLASVVEPLPAGDIAPTKPLPIPAQQPQLPQEVQPAPQQPPPPPRRVQQAPQQAQPTATGGATAAGRGAASRTTAGGTTSRGSCSCATCPAAEPATGPAVPAGTCQDRALSTMCSCPAHSTIWFPKLPPRRSTAGTSPGWTAAPPRNARRGATSDK